jgi:hypothetical protein
MMMPVDKIVKESLFENFTLTAFIKVKHNFLNQKTCHSLHTLKSYNHQNIFGILVNSNNNHRTVYSGTKYINFQCLIQLYGKKQNQIL